MSSSTIKRLVNILPEAKYVMIHAAPKFTTNLRIEDLFEPDVIFATHHNMGPINSGHGALLRFVVPRLYLWKSASGSRGLNS